MAETTNDMPAEPGATAAALDPTAGQPSGVAPASDFSPSGAPRQVTDVDVGHPAVDNDPRANTTPQMNRIDFNDPVKTGAEIAADQLKAQAKA